MIRCKKENVEWLEFELLQNFPELSHGVFLRHGGVSKEPFSSLNLGGGKGDDPENIRKNKEKVCTCLGVDALVCAQQMHGARVERVDNRGFSNNCDGLITNKQAMPLMIRHADCQAAIFFDFEKHAIANVHCGWRGSVKNIYRETVQAMAREFGSKPKNLIVCISPSLGPNHAEFIHYKQELPQAFEPFQVKPTYFDFWSISRLQLESEGILKEHIEIANLCTYSGESDFFSYRREKKTGGHGTVVVLKSAPRYQGKNGM